MFYFWSKGFDDNGREVTFTAASSDTPDKEEETSLPAAARPLPKIRPFNNRNPVGKTQPRNINSALDGTHRLIGLNVDQIFNAGT